METYRDGNFQFWIPWHFSGYEGKEFRFIPQDHSPTQKGATGIKKQLCNMYMGSSPPYIYTYIIQLGFNACLALSPLGYDLGIRIKILSFTLLK